MCEDHKDKLIEEPLDLTDAEKKEYRQQHGAKLKRISDKAFSSTMKELQRAREIIPPSSGWKPTVRRLAHLDPNTDKRRKVNLLSRAEAKDQSSTSEEDPSRVFGPSDQQKAQDSARAKLVGKKQKKRSDTYSASGSAQAPAVKWDPYFKGGSHGSS